MDVPRTVMSSLMVRSELASAVPLRTALLVTASDIDVPLSVTSAIVGTGGVVSRVNANAAFVETKPAVSVWRTNMDFAPSPLTLRLVPVPVFHEVPLSREYCHNAPALRPVTLIRPLLVI